MREPMVVDTSTLCEWLENEKQISILDIRPLAERAEWFIPESLHYDAYKKLWAKDPNALHGVHLDKKIPVVTVCAAGKTSMLAAELLTKQGYKAYSLKDGMNGWSLAWNKAALWFPDYRAIQLRRTGKGCLSYIIVSDDEAIIIDASLPSLVYENLITQNKWQVKAAMETHIHADHLSRSKQVAEHFGVPLLLPGPNKVAFAHQKLEAGNKIVLGKVSIEVLSTPGHTMESVCFLVNDQVLFSGDTIFTNAVGRPDLKANEGEAKIRAEFLYDSLQRLMELKDNIIVMPAHTSTPTEFNGKPVAASIGEIKKAVSILQLSKVDFVKTILEKLPPAPPNHLAIVERNLSGNMAGVNPINLEAGANRCAVL